MSPTARAAALGVLSHIFYFNRGEHHLYADDINRLNGDARVVLIAGGDTTASALTAIFYLLAHHPHEIEKLRRELEPRKWVGVRVRK